VANTPLLDIIEFMSYEKLFVDMQNLACALHKKKPFQTKDNSSFKKQKYDKGKKANIPYKKTKESPGLKPDSECPIHGEHPWNKCFDNPQGESYKLQNALIFQGVDEVAAAFKILVKERLAKAMTMATVLASILFSPNHLQILHRQQQKLKNSTSLTVLAKIPNGDGMMQTILLTHVN
jgi:hypothetical protein